MSINNFIILFNFMLIFKLFLAGRSSAKKCLSDDIYKIFVAYGNNVIFVKKIETC